MTGFSPMRPHGLRTRYHSHAAPSNKGPASLGTGFPVFQSAKKTNKGAVGVVVDA